MGKLLKKKDVKRKPNAKRKSVKEIWMEKYFGKIKSFGDGVEFQRKMRDE